MRLLTPALNRKASLNDDRGTFLARIRRSFTHDAGFTLGELLVVVIIVGILSAIAVPMYINQRRQAEKASMKQLAHDLGVTFETISISEEWVNWPGVVSNTSGGQTHRILYLQYMGTQIYLGGEVHRGEDPTAFFAARPGLEQVMTQTGWWDPNEREWIWQKDERTTTDMAVNIRLTEGPLVNSGARPSTHVVVSDHADFVNRAVTGFDRDGDGRLMSPSPDGPYYDEFSNYYAAAWAGYQQGAWTPVVTWESGSGVR
jgi:prepilin-type N-terminal cleavage/methylation domain-containing protein